jgi:hypothetical protein
MNEFWRLLIAKLQHRKIINKWFFDSGSSYTTSQFVNNNMKTIYKLYFSFDHVQSFWIVLSHVCDDKLKWPWTARFGGLFKTMISSSLWRTHDWICCIFSLDNWILNVKRCQYEIKTKSIKKITDPLLEEVEVFHRVW